MDRDGTLRYPNLFLFIIAPQSIYAACVAMKSSFI